MDPYVIPGTDVLKNLRGIRDLDVLAAFEASATSRRLAALLAASIQGRFDVAHLKNVHRFIFQDVYPWAGEFRSVNISKGGSTFAFAHLIEPALGDLLRRLAGENLLHGLDIDSFSKRAGFYLGELNAAHPFREGNGRTQREFLRQLGLKAGYKIDWRRTTRDEMTAASVESFTSGQSVRMATLVRMCTTLIPLRA